MFPCPLTPRPCRWAVGPLATSRVGQLDPLAVLAAPVGAHGTVVVELAAQGAVAAVVLFTSISRQGKLEV